MSYDLSNKEEAVDHVHLLEQSYFLQQKFRKTEVNNLIQLIMVFLN